MLSCWILREIFPTTESMQGMKQWHPGSNVLWNFPSLSRIPKFVCWMQVQQNIPAVFKEKWMNLVKWTELEKKCTVLWSLKILRISVSFPSQYTFHKTFQNAYFVSFKSISNETFFWVSRWKVFVRPLKRKSWKHFRLFQYRINFNGRRIEWLLLVDLKKSGQWTDIYD